MGEAGSNMRQCSLHIEFILLPLWQITIITKHVYMKTTLIAVAADIIDFAIKHAEPLPQPPYVYLYNGRYHLTD